MGLSVRASRYFMVNRSCRYVRSLDFENRALGGPAVLLNAANHQYFGVNRVGTRIWALLAEPRSLVEIVTVLMGEFSVDEPTCVEQTELFLRQLEAARMIVPLP